MKEPPIYLVKHIPTGKVRLVRAANAARALRHVTAATHTVSIPTANRLVELVKEGCYPEDAGAKEPEPMPASISGLIGAPPVLQDAGQPALVADLNDGSDPD